MPGERLLFNTSRFREPKVDRENSYTMDGIREDELMVGDWVDFGGRSSGWLRLAKTKTGQTIWADAVVMDLEKGFQFYYDHNYCREAMSNAFGKDPYEPYQAAILISSAREVEDGRISGDVEYGDFYYDGTGKLRTIKAEQITQGTYEPDISFINLRQGGNGLWLVYPVRDIQEPTMRFDLDGQTMEPTAEVVADGTEFEAFELVYSLLEHEGSMRLTQRTITGHKRKIVEVPSTIYLPRWSYLLGSTNGEWVKSLQEFPSYVEIFK